MQFKKATDGRCFIYYKKEEIPILRQKYFDQLPDISDPWRVELFVNGVVGEVTLIELFCDHCVNQIFHMCNKYGGRKADAIKKCRLNDFNDSDRPLHQVR